jgi:hypothetical protein
MSEMVCLTCKKPLDIADDLCSQNCGGDCLSCMANAEDPECFIALFQKAIENLHDFMASKMYSDRIYTMNSYCVATLIRKFLQIYNDHAETVKKSDQCVSFDRLLFVKDEYDSFKYENKCYKCATE